MPEAINDRHIKNKIIEDDLDRMLDDIRKNFYIKYYKYKVKNFSKIL
jgi:hypothetical protein